MTKVLVTGATGFIGLRVVSRLLEEGAHVLPVSLSGRGGVSLDLKNTEAVKCFLKRECPDHLIHLAWNVNAGYMESVENLEWVTASLELLKAFAKNGGQRAVFAGSCIEYDWKYGYLSEDLTPLGSDSLYAVSKSALYKMALAYSRRMNLSFVWGRIFFLYGDGEKRERLVPSLIDAFLKGDRPNLKYPHLRRDYLHVDDVAAALVALLSSACTGAINIASGEAVCLGDIGRKIASLMGCQAPDWGEQHDMRVPPCPLVLGDVRKLTEIVGFRPLVSWEDGLLTMIEQKKRELSG